VLAGQVLPTVLVLVGLFAVYDSCSQVLKALGSFQGVLINNRSAGGSMTTCWWCWTWWVKSKTMAATAYDTIAILAFRR
jgi:hypothetical protein